MKKMIITLKGMTCNHCVMNVKNVLSGIENVKVLNVEINKATIEVEKSEKLLDNIKQKIKMIGYEVVSADLI